VVVLFQKQEVVVPVPVAEEDCMKEADWEKVVEGLLLFPLEVDLLVPTMFLEALEDPWGLETDPVVKLVLACLDQLFVLTPVVLSSEVLR